MESANRAEKEIIYLIANDKASAQRVFSSRIESGWFGDGYLAAAYRLSRQYWLKHQEICVPAEFEKMVDTMITSKKIKNLFPNRKGYNDLDEQTLGMNLHAVFEECLAEAAIEDMTVEQTNRVLADFTVIHATKTLRESLKKHLPLLKAVKPWEFWQKMEEDMARLRSTIEAENSDDEPKATKVTETTSKIYKGLCEGAKEVYRPAKELFGTNEDSKAGSNGENKTDNEDSQESDPADSSLGLEELLDELVGE